MEVSFVDLKARYLAEKNEILECIDSEDQINYMCEKINIFYAKK